jgi:formylglycine-generating enzyme required for sulfatase activity
MMQHNLSGKKGLWNNLVKGARSVFSPRIYAAEIMSASQAELADRSIEANNEREQKREEIRKLDLMLREVQHKESLSAQEQEGELNREAQLQLARFQQEFLERQALLNRDHTEKIELFRADLQKWAVQQQKELQLELKQLELDQAREQRLVDRQTAMEVIKAQKRESNSPIWLLAEDLIGHDSRQAVVPLRVLFSPPATLADSGFPEMERSLGRDLRQFFDTYSANGRPIEFLAGAWNSKFFHSEAATKAIFRGLKTEPVMILEAMVEGDIFDLNFAYWGMNWPTYRYKTAVSLSWQEALYDFAKARTLVWVKKQRELQRDRPQMVGMYGEQVVSNYLDNLQIYRREQACLKQGEDPTEIERRYHLQNQDYEDLRNFVGICHCLFAGILADEYFLLHVPPQHRQPPLLPSLLEELLLDIPDSVATELIELVVTSYETIYEMIAQTESSWVPEFQIDLAHSLLDLPQQFRAQEKVDASIDAWLELNGVEQPEDRYVSLAQLLTIVDVAYVQKLNECLERLGHKTQFSVAQSCYQRGLTAFDQQDFATARSEFQAAVQADPNLAEAHFSLGCAQMRDRQLDAAIAALSRSIQACARATAEQAQTTMGKAYYQRGLIYEQQGHLKLAAADYRTAGQQGLSEALLASEHLQQHVQEQQSAADLQKHGDEFSIDTVRINDLGELQPVPIVGRSLKIVLGDALDMELVYLAGGQFTMGSVAQRNERPPHIVAVAPLHFGRYPIRQDQWAWVAGLPIVERALETNPSQFPGDSHPVDNISWLDGVEFCQRLSRHTGQLYRLPSEAEWEYACRANTDTPFTYGNSLTSELANFTGGVGDSLSVSLHRTTAVGHFPPNGFGIYDLHGNIWEWCADLWHENYNGAPKDRQPWLQNPTSEHRVLRGGSWFNNQWNCRSSNRNWVNPEVRSWLYGLRVVTSSFCLV